MRTVVEVGYGAVGIPVGVTRWPWELTARVRRGRLWCRWDTYCTPKSATAPVGYPLHVEVGYDAVGIPVGVTRWPAA